MVTRIWHGATPAAKSDEYLTVMRTVAIPDYRSTPGNKGAYALRRMELLRVSRLWLASGWGCQSRRRTTSHRTFTPYFCVIGGTIPFKRRYSTSCP
jgi:hypothetical protein